MFGQNNFRTIEFSDKIMFGQTNVQPTEVSVKRIFREKEYQVKTFSSRYLRPKNCGLKNFQPKIRLILLIKKLKMNNFRIILVSWATK